MNKSIIGFIIIFSVILFVITGCGSNEKNTQAAQTTGSASNKESLGSSENTKEIQSLKQASDACAEEPTRCNDDSGLLALTQAANQENVCDEISHAGWKQICLALVNKNLKTCDKFVDADTEHMVPEHYKAWCKMHVVAVMGRSELCESTEFAYPGQSKEASISECYMTYAIANKEKGLCAKTDDKAYCEREYDAVNEKSLSVCEHSGDICYLDYAFRFNDKSACEKASTPFQLACEVQLTGDSQACRQIHDLDQWYFCDLRSKYH